jgi:3,4-dihydroxy-9,10-secoandrosta-1,3,5(10)-triene-9,17-dione 4,5-dioxygenase
MPLIQALAYLVAESPEPQRWATYAQDLLGAMAVPGGDGVDIKIDERHGRLLIRRGPADRYAVSGWEVADAATLQRAVAALRQAGVEVREGDAAARGFSQLYAFSDPAGNAHELVSGYVGATAAFRSPLGVAGFKTGAQGLGHTVLPAPQQFDATLALFKDVLGMGLSDVFNFQPAPDAPVMRIYFLHGASGRHHSLALAEMPSPSGCVHAMLEVEALTDVGKAYDRREKAGIKLMATLGEHENDRMTSFYLMTPGGFALEYGWGGIDVDPASWQTTQTKQVSIWGHDFSVGFR